MWWNRNKAYYSPNGDLLAAHTYADGSTVTYTYTPDNLPLCTTYASGKWKENFPKKRAEWLAVGMEIWYDRHACFAMRPAETLPRPGKSKTTKQ